MFSFFRKNNPSLSSADLKLEIALKNLLGYKPKNLFLYKQALRHRSAATSVKEGADNSNERLEYLGDAILGAIIAEYLFKRYPFKDEGFLTKMRSRMVSRETLSGLSRKMGLEQWVEKQGPERNLNKSLHGDALEALLGAVYLDQGFEITKKFISERVILPHLNVEEMELNDTDFKSRVIAWAQKGHIKSEFRISDEQGASHNKTYTIELFLNEQLAGTGKAGNKKKAEQFASEEALKTIPTLFPELGSEL